jgi:hypothetical protein
MTDEEKEKWEDVPQYEKGPKMLNENQVLAAKHFVKRVKAFMKHIVNQQV